MSDVEARLAEALAGHGPVMATYCACGWRARSDADPASDLRAHIAAVLAPIIAAEVARAMDAAAVALEAEVVGFHPALGTAAWLRARAARIVREAKS